MLSRGDAIGCSELDVGCWMFPVFNFHGPTDFQITHSRLKRIKLFLCDVDGVLTDGSVFIGGAREIKRFNIRDGLGLVFLRRAGFKVGWVSARPSAVTELRARRTAN